MKLEMEFAPGDWVPVMRVARDEMLRHRADMPDIVGMPVIYCAWDEDDIALWPQPDREYPRRWVERWS